MKMCFNWNSILLLMSYKQKNTISINSTILEYECHFLHILQYKCLFSTFFGRNHSFRHFANKIHFPHVFFRLFETYLNWNGIQWHFQAKCLFQDILQKKYLLPTILHPKSLFKHSSVCIPQHKYLCQSFFNRSTFLRHLDV